MGPIFKILGSNIQNPSVLLKTSFYFQLKLKSLAIFNIQKNYYVSVTIKEITIIRYSIKEHLFPQGEKYLETSAKLYKNFQEGNVCLSVICNTNKYLVLHKQTDQLFNEQTYFLGWQVHELN